MISLEDMKRFVLPAPLGEMQQNQQPTAVLIRSTATSAGVAAKQTLNKQVLNKAHDLL